TPSWSACPASRPRSWPSCWSRPGSVARPGRCSARAGNRNPPGLLSRRGFAYAPYVTSDSTPQAEGEPAPETFRLLRDERFLRYLWAKFLSLAGQNALIYGLFIAVITRQESSLATSAFVLASVVPSILLSVPGRHFADLTPNKFGLLRTLGLRIVVVHFFLHPGSATETAMGLTFSVRA